MIHFYNNLSSLLISLLLLCQWGEIKTLNILRPYLLPAPADCFRAVKFIWLILGWKMLPEDTQATAVLKPCPNKHKYTCACSSCTEETPFQQRWATSAKHFSGTIAEELHPILSPQGNCNLRPDETCKSILWWGKKKIAFAFCMEIQT